MAKAVKVASFDHDRIMEEAGRRNRLEYKNDKECNNVDNESRFRVMVNPKTSNTNLKNHIIKTSGRG